MVEGRSAWAVSSVFLFERRMGLCTNRGSKDVQVFFETTITADFI